MSFIIDKVKNWFTPVTPPTEDSIKELQTKTQLLEQQADLAETEEKLRKRSDKAKKRIKTAKRGTDKRLLYILAGLVFLVIIIWIFAGSC